MICNSCKHDFCWICSLPFYTKKHEIFKPFCETMNVVVYNEGEFESMWIKCIWLRFLAYFFLVIFGPILLLAASPFLAIFFGPCYLFSELKYGYLCFNQIYSSKLRFLLSFPISIVIWLIIIVITPFVLPVYFIVFLVFSIMIMIE